MSKKVNIFWFRRDLRLDDNAGLYHALKGKYPVVPIFIFDSNILDKLSDRSDARVHFIHDALQALHLDISTYNSSLQVYAGRPEKVWKELLSNYDIETVYTNHDFESYAIERDTKVKKLLEKQKVDMKTYKDHVLMEAGEVLKDDGLPYTVFTPYKRKWIAKVSEGKDDLTKSYYLKSYPTLKYATNFKVELRPMMPSLKDIGFEPSDIPFPSQSVARKLIKDYGENRNFPAVDGTSKLGVHFRFGTVSIREKARKAIKLSDVYLSELIWRDFYAQILSKFPHVEENAFRAKYEKVEWRNNEDEFAAWCAGKTGYPMVDAGMRELNNTGYMHNRVRMVVASFLTKHLLIDWRWGEAYFAEKLLDFDLASNNGGWQWAAGCGTDAAPYFRIFNPTSQLTKFDKNLVYTKKWVPEYGTPEYPEPIVDHKMARERCLTAYKTALNNA